MKITLLYGILKIKEFYSSNISKTFQKSKAQPISKRELIFEDLTHIYISFVQVFLGNYRLSLDHKWKNLHYAWQLEKYSVEHKESFSNCAETSRETKISGGTNILRTSGYCFPTGYFSKWNTVLAREVPKSALCVGSWKLNTFT